MLKKRLTKRKVVVTATFVGNGRIRRLGKGQSFSGGVPTPKIESSELSFSLHKESKDRNGIWNPPIKSTVTGGFQINIHGTAKGYRKLAEYFLALSEIDSRADGDFHEQVEGLWDTAKTASLHLIFRKRYGKSGLITNGL
jgi:hypothetical protein